MTLFIQYSFSYSRLGVLERVQETHKSQLNEKILSIIIIIIISHECIFTLYWKNFYD